MLKKILLNSRQIRSSAYFYYHYNFSTTLLKLNCDIKLKGVFPLERSGVITSTIDQY
jgi:hypothetical protein